MGILLVLTVFTPFFKSADSAMGRSVTLLASLYFYVRWQIDVVRIPKKVDYPTDADMIAFYRMTRSVYLEFSCLVLALFNFCVARLRGRIDTLETGEKAAKAE